MAPFLSPPLTPALSGCKSLAPPALVQGSLPGPQAHLPAPAALSSTGGAPPAPGLSQPMLHPRSRPQESGGSAGQASAPRLAAGPGERLSQPEASLRGSARPPPAAQMAAGVRGGARPSSAFPNICCLPRQEAHPGEGAWQEGLSEELPSQTCSCLWVPRAGLLLLKPGCNLLTSGLGNGLCCGQSPHTHTPRGLPRALFPFRLGTSPIPPPICCITLCGLGGGWLRGAPAAETADPGCGAPVWDSSLVTTIELLIVPDAALSLLGSILGSATC